MGKRSSRRNIKHNNNIKLPSAPQTGGAPGSIASSPLVPPLKLKTITDLFSTKSNVFTLQSPADNIMNSKILTTTHNFFHNLNAYIKYWF